MTAPVIDDLPPAPQRADEPATFVSKADAFVAALAVLVAQVNGFGDYINDLGLDPADTVTEETVRDVIMAMFQDSSTIDFTNNDGSDTATADVIMSAIKPTESLIIACSDESSALAAGTAKITFRMPYAFTLTAVRASLTTAQASGSIFTVDINEGGTTILSTKLTIDNTEKTSATAATPAVISDSSLADDAEITVDVDQVGASGAAGLKVYLIGRRT